MHSALQSYGDSFHNTSTNFPSFMNNTLDVRASFRNTRINFNPEPRKQSTTIVDSYVKSNQRTESALIKRIMEKK